MQSESGSGGNEDAPAHEAGQVRIVRRAETRERAQAQARAKADEEHAVWVQAEVARAEALVRALALATRTYEVDMPLERAKALLESALNYRTVQFLSPETILPHPYAPTYREVLADLKIMVIINSIEPRYRHRLARKLWPHSEHRWLIEIIVPVARLPLELLQSILSTIIDDASNSPLVLMLVCKHWYTVTTTIWVSLKLETRTPRDAVTRKVEGNPWLLDIVVDTEIDRGDFTPSEGAYEGIFAAIEATSRWRSLVVETFPGQADLPEHLVNPGLQRCSNATMSRLETFKMKCACEMSPLLDRLLRILGTTAGPELSTVEINSANVISFLVPAYSPIFRSVKVLYLDVSGTHDPVDLLPHLHQLEELTASHLPLPIYGLDIILPFVTTLRHLRLRAVSIQWMSGRTFDSLESCTILFPLHRHISHGLRTTLPNCKDLAFQGYPLNMLDSVSVHKLIHLSVTSSGSFNGRGHRQLIWFSSQVLGGSRLAPRILHISIEATSQAWVNALTFMPHLEELVIGNERPSSLEAKVFQSLIAQPVHKSNLGATSATGEWRAPLCPLLRRFGLKYRRWLRTSEQFDLIPDLASIIWFRRRPNYALQSFCIWTRSDQEDPLELVEGSQISFDGVERLADESGFKRENVLNFVLMGLMQPTFKTPRGPFLLYHSEHHRHLRVMSTREEVPSNYGSTDSPDDELEDSEEDDPPTINDVESLKKGIIRTSKSEVQAPYTILLVGETGVGKSAFMQFLANALIGNDIDNHDYNTLDGTNEQGGPDNQSQTNYPHLYEITSTNGIAVRILDTPGLADTRGTEHDEHHKKNIVTEIQRHIHSVNAVFILANGTIPRITVSTDYALSTLSSIFPKSLAGNIAFMFTNVPSPLSWNFSQRTIPDVLKHAPRFLLDNPIALQRRFLGLMSDPKQKKNIPKLRKGVQACEKEALEMLVELFDWLDGLEPQPTKEIVYLYHLSQTIEASMTNTLAQMDQAAAKKVEVDKLMRALEDSSYDMNVICNVENTVTKAVWKLQDSPTSNIVCGHANCYSNCDIDRQSNIALDLNGRFRGSCDKCSHLWNHHRCCATWGHVIDTQVLIDKNVKKKWETAKDGREKVAVLVELHAKVLGDLNQVINRATSELAQLVERYGRLSLSGHFLAQVGNTVRLLEQKYTALKGKTDDQDQLQKVAECLGRMEKELVRLNTAENARKACIGILGSKVKK